MTSQVLGLGLVGHVLDSITGNPRKTIGWLNKTESRKSGR